MKIRNIIAVSLLSFLGGCCIACMIVAAMLTAAYIRSEAYESSKDTIAAGEYKPPEIVYSESGTDGSRSNTSAIKEIFAKQKVKALTKVDGKFIKFIPVTKRKIIKDQKGSPLKGVWFPKGFKKYGSNELLCMAANIYYEGRSEKELGQVAIGFVVKQRQLSDEYPDSICSVVAQDMQFSWYDSNKLHMIDDIDAWEKAVGAAKLVIHKKTKNPVPGSLFYHRYDVIPKWDTDMVLNRIIGSHIFFN